MRVLRHRNLLGCLAIFAFAMQVVLAFAETHTHTYTRAGPDRLAARAITFGMCKPGIEKPCPAPAQHNDHGKCQLCFSLAMAGTGVLQAPPVILPSQPAVVALGPVRIAQIAEGQAHRNFQARAPPLA